MEEVKRKRGRPRKVKLPEEILTKLDEVIEEVKNKDKQEIHNFVELYKLEKRKGLWDYKLGDEVKFFDPTKSYEHSGYRPITETLGLDFNPDWFTETRKIKEKTGHYSQFHFGTKAYRDFWNELYKRCRDGYTVNGYTITGNHYFFLNFYTLKDSRVEKAGTARKDIFPRFMSALYEFFHYFELCKILRKNVCMMKSRAVGQ